MSVKVLTAFSVYVILDVENLFQQLLLKSWRICLREMGGSYAAGWVNNI